MRPKSQRTGMCSAFCGGNSRVSPFFLAGAAKRWATRHSQACASPSVSSQCMPPISATDSVCRSSTSRLSCKTSSRRPDSTCGLGERAPSSMASSSPRKTDRGVRSSCEIWAIQLRRASSRRASSAAMVLMSSISCAISRAPVGCSGWGRLPRAMSRLARCRASSGRLQRPAIHHAAMTASAMLPSVAQIRRLVWRCRNRASTPSGSGSATRSTYPTSCPLTLKARVVLRTLGGWGRPVRRWPCRSRMRVRSPRLPRGH